MCCRRGWRDKSNGCDGSFGGARGHVCVMKPSGQPKLSKAEHIQIMKDSVFFVCIAKPIQKFVLIFWSFLLFRRKILVIKAYSKK